MSSVITCEDETQTKTKRTSILVDMLIIVGFTKSDYLNHYVLLKIINFNLKRN